MKGKTVIDSIELIIQIISLNMTVSLMYTMYKSCTYNSLSQDIYAAYFLKLLDIYKYMGVQTMLIQYSMKNSQGLSFETSSLACQVYYTAKKMSTGFLHCNLDESTRMIS